MLTLFSITFIIVFILIYYTKINDKNNNQSSINNNNNKNKLKFINIDYLSSKNFSFYPYKLNGGKKNSRSIVLLFTWLFAENRHVDKYRQLYLELGFDVLTIRANLFQILFPTIGTQKMMKQTLKFIRNNREQYDHYLCHAFSIGAYVMGEGLVLLQNDKNQNLTKYLQIQMKGIIIDSAVDVPESPVGLAKATTSNSILQIIIMKMMKFYFKINYFLATKHYIKSSRELHINPLNFPLLIFLSKDDPACNYFDQFKMFEKLKNMGIISEFKCWEQSQHVAHYLRYPDEYRSTLIKFINIVIKDNNDNNNNNNINNKIFL